MRTFTYLGVKVNPLTIDQLNEQVDRACRTDETRIIAHQNLHGVYLSAKDPRMQAFYARADVVHLDGMALVALGRLLGYPLQRDERVTYVDWIRPLMRQAQVNGWRVYYLGSKPGVAAEAAHVLREEFPGLSIRTRNGYFDVTGGENQAVLDDIADFRPHVLMVGMGMPRQERWIIDNLPMIEANAILPSGACFDYVAGAVATPPRWMGRVGLEWLYRLVTEPKRLWRRYLVEPWYVAALLLRDVCARVRRGSHSNRSRPTRVAEQ